jgi:hypothetical protein
VNHSPVGSGRHLFRLARQSNEKTSTEGDHFLVCVRPLHRHRTRILFPFEQNGVGCAGLGRFLANSAWHVLDSNVSTIASAKPPPPARANAHESVASGPNSFAFCRPACRLPTTDIRQSSSFVYHSTSLLKRKPVSLFSSQSFAHSPCSVFVPTTRRLLFPKFLDYNLTRHLTRRKTQFNHGGRLANDRSEESDQNHQEKEEGHDRR